MILRSLLIVATPYGHTKDAFDHKRDITYEWVMPSKDDLDGPYEKHSRDMPFWTHAASIFLLIIFFFFLLHFTHSYAYLLSMASMDH